MRRYDNKLGNKVANLASGMNAHVYPSILRNESRIFKIAKSIIRNEMFTNVSIIGKHEKGLKNREFLSENILLIRLTANFPGLRGSPAIPLKVFIWYLKAFIELLRLRPSCINAHSLPVLPLCALAKLATGAKLIYDTHELETEVMRSKGLFRIIYKTTEAIFIGFCDEVSVVNTEIADWYKDRYNLERVWVVENVPEILGMPSGPSGLLRNALQIPVDSLIFLYQGLLAEGRGLRQLLAAFREVPGDRHLVFLGYGPLAEEIRLAAAQLQNVHYHDAVSVDQLPFFTADADVGLSLIENICLSYYLSLPNKLFEYISCGIPVVASDFPALKRVLEYNECGWLIKPLVNDVRNLISSISCDEILLKTRMAKKARQTIGWNYQESELIRMYSSLKDIGQN